MMDKTAASPLLDALLDRLDEQEALELEFKTARGGLPSSIWETVSAFANTQGGWILLGVEEKDQIATVSGVPNADQVLRQLNDQIRNRGKISFPACGAGDTSVERIDGRDVIVLRVPAAARRDKPVYINSNAYGGTYLRRHSGDYHCTKPEVDRMMREASDVAADSTVLDRFGLDDLDREALARYRRRYQTANPGSP